MEHEALATNEATIIEQRDRWLREYMRGGPDRRAKCQELGATAEAIEKATNARQRWDAEQAQWLRDEVGELDRPMAKVIPAVAPGTSSGQSAITVGATSSPDRGSPTGAAQASVSPLSSGAPVGAPSVSPVMPPPTVWDRRKQGRQ